MKVSAGISPCPNDVFVFAGLIGGEVAMPGLEFEFDFEDVETLNLGTQAGRWDLAKISYANYRRIENGYALLRSGGALGRGCGPLLLSNGFPWDPSAEVLVPGENTTANFLLDYYHSLSAAPALRKRYLPFDEVYAKLRGTEPCQGVVIHEMRFTYAAHGLRLIRDLGSHWEESTGHPIPLGALALNRDLEEKLPDARTTLESLIRASLDWSHAHRREALALCRRHSQSLSEDVLESHIRLYVNDFTRDLGPMGETAIGFFLERQKAFSHKGSFFPSSSNPA